MSEEFFERLRERTLSHRFLEATHKTMTVPMNKYPERVIDATIEALKEMMVGEKKMFRISHHTKHDGEEWTLVRHFSQEHITLDGHRGTDGEEVVVMVFGDGEER